MNVSTEYKIPETELVITVGALHERLLQAVFSNTSCFNVKDPFWRCFKPPRSEVIISRYFPGISNEVCEEN